jgi:hypothetical protein
MLKVLCSALAVLALPLAASATEYRTVERPRQQCWNEQVAAGRSGDYGGAVLGGIAGGLLGNTVGGGNGRTAATAVGAVTGAIVGDRTWGGGQPSYQTVQRCRTVVDQVQVPVYDAPVYRTPVISAPVVIEQPAYYLAPNPDPYSWRREQWRREEWRREQRRHEREEQAEHRRHDWREHHWRDDE